jgi:hypothetical protein
MLLTALGAFLGALLSLLISIFIEYQRKPKLTFTIEDSSVDMTYESAPAKNARFVRVHLYNQPMPKLFRWLGRTAAMQCSGEIQFHHITDGAPVFARPMPIRWAGSDEPLSHQVLSDGRVARMFDPTKYNAAFRRDCYPGSKETMDVAARFDDDKECYGWSNETYLPGKGWRNNDWRLPPGRYLVTLKVRTAGEEVIAAFQLENSVGREHFRLMPATPEDVRKLGLKH